MGCRFFGLLIGLVLLDLDALLLFVLYPIYHRRRSHVPTLQNTNHTSTSKKQVVESKPESGNL